MQERENMGWNGSNFDEERLQQRVTKHTTTDRRGFNIGLTSAGLTKSMKETDEEKESAFN
jgi:hypothetical protein